MAYRSAGDIFPTFLGLGWEDWLRAAIIAVVGVATALVARRALRRAGTRAVARRATVDMVARLAFITIVALTLYAALASLGIRLGPIVAGAGIVGVSVGFALKDIVSNHVAGMLLGFNNPFQAGDLIVVDGLSGVVEDLRLRNTQIRTGDGVRLLIPNSLIIQKPLENLTVNGCRCTTLDVVVAHDTDLPAVLEAFETAAAAAAGVLEQPPARARVAAIRADGVLIKVSFWHLPPAGDMLTARNDVALAVLAAARAADVDLHLAGPALPPGA